MNVLTTSTTDLQVLVRKVAERAIFADIVKRWDWGEGVALAGVTRAHALTGDQTLMFAQSWINDQLSLNYPVWNVNRSALSVTLLHLYTITQDERYLNACEENINYLLNEASRVGKGAIEHTVTLNVWPKQVWADTLFMAGIFIGKYGKLTGNTELVDACAEQFVYHLDYLSAADGLFYHGWNEVNRNHMSAVKWARANAWITVTCAEVLTDILTPEHPLYGTIAERYRQQVDALLPLQDAETGFWHTVLDDPAGYLETSASCGFAYGILRGIRAGLLDESYRSVVEPTFYQLVNHQIDDYGTVHGVSAGTDIYESAADYNAVPIHLPHGWGQGLALYLITEWIEDQRS
ncbi:hypothetical protein SY83_03060 [Paenibacillus swuensis]|uniref:Glycosyl hydrolase family 88 n=1 Tax=Paenibacillus swuensis TaxID=1178515 RepID=A0A172TEJ6_9BACL|nr:glycoside hydrolase family 88 protein [Paenibacillus swuensis]ANE45468.1 hypothetical protein SY83_03060 [Paenibacillus swuensis]